MQSGAARAVIVSCSVIETMLGHTRLRRGPRWLNNHVVPAVARRSYREGPTVVNGVTMTIPRPPDWGGGGEFHMALGTYERPELRFLRETLKPGDTFVDVGAHIGYIALPAAHAVGPSGRVIAIEALAESASLLRAHRELNELHWLEVHECAAASHDGTVTFNVSGVSPMWGSIAERDGTSALREVRAVRLDTLLCGTPVSGMKIDVEGAEAAVLHGMGATIAANPGMFLIVECEGGRRRAQSDETLALLAGYGFKLHTFRGFGGPRQVSAGEVQALLGDGRPFNLLCRR